MSDVMREPTAGFSRISKERPCLCPLLRAEVAEAVALHFVSLALEDHLQSSNHCSNPFRMISNAFLVGLSQIKLHNNSIYG